MILFLIKVFDEEEYAAAFLDGTLFARRLRCFKEMEEADGRGDKYEGAIMPAISGLTITLKTTDVATGEVDKITMTEEDFAAPPVMQPEWFDHVNVFCMYAGHSGNISPNNAEDFKRQLELPEDYLELGDHAVVIKNTTEFFKRVDAAVKETGHGFRRGLVRYYDLESGTPVFASDVDTIFSKRLQYEHQKEYRFAIDAGDLGCDPITLDIGPIDDIALQMKASDFNSSLRLQFHDIS